MAPGEWVPCITPLIRSSGPDRAQSDPPGYERDPGMAEDFERRFKQELLMARQVTHRNVTRIHDLGNAGGVRYITMQFVEGTNLAGSSSRGPSHLLA